MFPYAYNLFNFLKIYCIVAPQIVAMLYQSGKDSFNLFHQFLAPLSASWEVLTASELCLTKQSVIQKQITYRTINSIKNEVQQQHGTCVGLFFAFHKNMLYVQIYISCVYVHISCYKHMYVDRRRHRTVDKRTSSGPVRGVVPR